MKNLWLALTATLVLGGAGCASWEKCADPVPAAEETQQLAPGVKLGNSLLEAIKNDNYAQFIASWPDAEMTETDFNASRNNFAKQFGELKSFAYLTELKTPLVKNNIWVVTFERKTSDDKDVVVQELLFRLVTGEVDGKLKILGMGFL